MYRVVYNGKVENFTHRKILLNWLHKINANTSAYEVARWSTVTGLTDVHLQIDCEEYFLKIDQS